MARPKLEEVIETVLYPLDLGVNVRLASFCPIPGTEAYDRAVAFGYFPQNADPLLTNKTIIPLYRTPNAYERFQSVRNFTNLLNDEVKHGKRIRRGNKFRTELISAIAL